MWTPFIESALRRFVPIVLALIGPPLIARGLLSEKEAAELIGLLTSAVIAFLLSAWQTYKSRQEKLVAQASERPLSKVEVKAIVAAGKAPSVNTPNDAVPRLAGE